MSDEATGGILQALEPRLAEIERRQDDLDVVVLETATMAKTLKDERDDARSAAQVQAGEIARMTAELQRAHEAGERMQAEVARLSLREPTNDEMERALAGGDEAFLVGTIRRCRHCRCAVFGGPTACVRCADRADLAAAVKRATALESANALGSAQVTQLQEELADTTAKLGRAVAALRKHRIDITSVARFVRDMGDMPNTVAAVQDFTRGRRRHPRRRGRRIRMHTSPTRRRARPRRARAAVARVGTRRASRCDHRRPSRRRRTRKADRSRREGDDRMSTHDANCPWIYGGACDCGLASDAAERDSLRRDLAVTRAALAQCATALREARAWIDPIGETSPGMAQQSRAFVDAALTVDVEHSVRVEAAREAVIQAVGALDKFEDFSEPPEHEDEASPQWLKARQAVGDSLVALDALTSEWRRDGGGA